MSMAHHRTTAGEDVEKHATFRVTHADGYQQRVDLHFGYGPDEYTNDVIEAAIEHAAGLRASPITEVKLIRIDDRLPAPEPPAE